MRGACIVVAATVVLLTVADFAAACPSCKEALGNSSGGGDLVSGFFWSILFMLSMPPLILGGLGSYFYWEIRKARQAQRPRAIEIPPSRELEYGYPVA